MKPQLLSPRPLRLLSLSAGLLFSFACGDSATTIGLPTTSNQEEMSEDNSQPNNDTDTKTPDAGVPTETTPLFALVTQVFGTDGADNQSYIVLTDSLDKADALTLDDAIELPGRSIGSGLSEGGAIFVGGDADATLTRYDLGADNTLVKGNTLSFLNQGLASIGEYGGQFQFVSETKAYFFDGATASMVIWNPEEMSVTGATVLDDLVLADSLLTFSASPLVLEDQLVTFAGWRAGPTVPSQAGVVFVDTETDAATVVLDDRCGYVRDGAMGSDGMLYVATEAYGSAVHLLNADNAAVPCLLRLDPATRTFDPDFRVELGGLLDGDTVGSLVRGPDDSVFLRVLDQTVFPVMADTSPRLLASVQAWRWASLQLGDTPTATRLDSAPGGGSVLMIDLGGNPIAAVYEGRAATAFAPLASTGLGAPSLNLPGLVFSGVRLR